MNKQQKKQIVLLSVILFVIIGTAIIVNAYKFKKPKYKFNVPNIEIQVKKDDTGSLQKGTNDQVQMPISAGLGAATTNELGGGTDVNSLNNAGGIEKLLEGKEVDIK